jgi:Flagellar hook-length control protein FliK
MSFTINPSVSAADDLLASMLLSGPANGIPGSTSVAPNQPVLASIEPRSFADFLVSQQASIKTGDPVQNVKQRESAAGTLLALITRAGDDTKTDSKAALAFAMPVSACDGKKAACPVDPREPFADVASKEEPVGKELVAPFAPVHLPAVSQELRIASSVANQIPVIQQPVAVQGYKVSPEARTVKSAFSSFPGTALVEEPGQTRIRQDLKVTGEGAETKQLPTPRMNDVGTPANLHVEGEPIAPFVQPQTPIRDKTNVRPLATEFAVNSPPAADKSTVASNRVVQRNDPVAKPSPELPDKQRVDLGNAVSNTSVSVDFSGRSALTATTNLDAAPAPVLQAAGMPNQAKSEPSFADLELPQGKLVDPNTPVQSLPPVSNRPVPAPMTVAKRIPVQPILVHASYGRHVPVSVPEPAGDFSRASRPDLQVGVPAPSAITATIPTSVEPAGSAERLPVDHGREPGFANQVSEKENPEIESPIEGEERWIPARTDRVVPNFGVSGYSRDQFPPTILAGHPLADRQRTAVEAETPVRRFDRQVSPTSLVSAAPVMPGRNDTNPVESAFQQLGAEFTGKEPGTDSGAGIDDGRRQENPASRGDFSNMTASGPGAAREAAGTPIFANDGAEETVFESRVLAKVLESIDFTVSEGQARDGGIDRVRIALDPPGLGELALEVSRSENGFRVLIVADRASTHALLERNIEVLESTLELTHGGVEVDVSRRHSRDQGPYPADQMWGHPHRSESLSPVEIPAPRRSCASAGGVDLFV